MSYYYSKTDIYNDLHRLDDRLRAAGQTLYLEIVGGGALILNDLHFAETEDLDTLVAITQEVKNIIDSCGVDINDDAREYCYSFDDGELIQDDELFTNITLTYYDLGTIIKSKLNYDDQYKAEKLYYVLEEELGVEMTVDGIVSYLDTLDTTVDEELVEEFLSIVNDG